LEKCAGILSPVLPVEINRQKVTALVPKHGIDSDDKVATPIITSRKVPANNLIGHSEEATVQAVSALDSRLLTDPSHPFIRAGRLVTRPPRLSTFKANRINILTPAK
jgi:hypothetical protein